MKLGTIIKICENCGSLFAAKITKEEEVIREFNRGKCFCGGNVVDLDKLEKKNV